MAGAPLFGGKTPTPGDVKNMVAAHSKVPDPLKKTYRKKVIGHARKAGAMQHIPPPWLKDGANTDTGSGATTPPSGKPNPFGGKKAAPFGKGAVPPAGGKKPNPFAKK